MSWRAVSYLLLLMLLLLLLTLILLWCRRQIQLQSVGALGARQALQNILHRDGVPGLYKGFLPNALKNLPNKGRCQATTPSAFLASTNAGCSFCVGQSCSC